MLLGAGQREGCRVAVQEPLDGDLIDVPLDSWQRCYDVNVVAPLLLSRTCARDMMQRGEGGAIVILSSYSAVVPPAGNGAIAGVAMGVGTGGAEGASRFARYASGSKAGFVATVASFFARYASGSKAMM